MAFEHEIAKDKIDILAHLKDPKTGRYDLKLHSKARSKKEALHNKMKK